MKNKLRFIIIDDDPTNNFIAEHLIKRVFKDIEIISFLYPEESLTFIENEYAGQKEQIKTIMLLDINMPILTGWDVLEKFKEFPASIHSQFRVYIHSSSVSKQDLVLAEEDPYVRDYVLKPLTNDYLLKLKIELEESPWVD